MLKYKTILEMQTICLGNCTHKVTVRYINDGYNIRVYVNDVINQEARCQAKDQIGIVARELLRWEHKMGNISDLSSSARERSNKD
jgi:hypothetical protein